MTLERFESQNAAALIAEKIAEHLDTPEKRQYFKEKIAISVFSFINFLPGTSEEFSGIHSEFSFVWGDYGGAEGWLGQHTIPGFTPSGILQPVSYSALNGLNNNFTLGWSQGQDSYYGLISIFNTLIGEMQVAANDFIGLMGNPGLYFDYVGAVVWVVATEAAYKLDFPSWASVPSWYHFATLIKADGTTQGKEIAALVNPPPSSVPLPSNQIIALEIWRQDPAILTDPIYDYFPRQLLQSSNLLEEFPDFPEDFEPTENPPEIPPDQTIPINFWAWSISPDTDHQFSDAQLTALVTDPETGEMIFDPNTDLGNIMPDSLRLKQIHAALEADRYGVHSDPTKQNLNNIGRLTEAVAYLLGISLNENGENIPYPDPQYLTPKEVSDLKHLKTSQFAAFDGAKGMQVASVYDIRSNVPVKDSFGKTVIQPGGGVKVWNLAQFLDQMADDTETQLGGAALASLQVPAGDGKSYIQYEGLGHALQDALFMLSVESKRVDELVIQSARTVHLLQQVLMGLGLPMRPDTIDFFVNAETATAEDPPKAAVAPVASLDPSGPTLTSLFGIVLANLSRLVAGSIGYTGTELTAAANTNPNFNFQDQTETTPPGAIDL